MLIFLIVGIALGGIAAGITGIGFLFWVVFIIYFICGLPFLLISGFIYDVVDYSQNRADYRDLMRDLAENERMDRYLDKLDEMDINNNSIIYTDNRQYNDNRQIHYHDTKDTSTNTTKIKGRRKNS